MSTISVINSANCEGCDQHMFGFRYQKSETIRKIQTNQLNYQIEGDTATGVLVHDQVRVDKDSQKYVKEFPFLLVNKWTQNRFEKIDGVIGLSKTYISEDGNNSVPSLLESLY